MWLFLGSGTGLLGGSKLFLVYVTGLFYGNKLQFLLNVDVQ